MLLVIIFSAYSPTLRAQESQTPIFWANAGIGVSSMDLSFGASLNFVASESDLITIRFCRNQQFALFTNGTYVWDFGAMYGLRTNSTSTYASISSGLALVGGANLGKYIPGQGWFSGHYEEITYMTVGIPFEAQFFWRPSSFLGIGICANANLNMKKSFAGAQLCLQFGKFEL